MIKENSPYDQLYPLLPLRDIVVFPKMVATLFVGRNKSVAALNSAMDNNQEVLLATQRDTNIEHPLIKDLYTVGVLGKITQMITLPDGTVKILVEGKERVHISNIIEVMGFLKAQASPVKIESLSDKVVQPYLNTLLESFHDYASLNKKVPQDLLRALSKLADPEQVIDSIAAQLPLSMAHRQEILECFPILERFEKVLEIVSKEIDALKIEEKIKSKVKSQIEKNQRDYYLNEQMKAIHSELQGGEEGDVDDIAQLQKRIKETKFPEVVRKKAEGEVKKLRMMNPMASETSIVRNYLEWLLDVPWNNPTKTKLDIKAAKKILDRDHYGLEKVKERILEYLAVKQRVAITKGQIICLVGPPGVGKTSLGKSIAEATGRKFVRISLGGVHDEAEIRGHRRTYIGAMPGKIIQAMKRAKTSNPIILLDEIDKLGSDYRGDPSAALLEVLDPEQNKAFNDNYLEVDYDLSDVMFIATANSLNIPRPLLDRMELIQISGYMEEEKIKIATRYMIDKQRTEHGLKKSEWDVSESAIREMIRSYTREAGVRSLERQISKLARRSLKKILTTSTKAVHVTLKNLKSFLGVPKYSFGLAETEPLIGVTTGLAWTEVGGEILLIESSLSEGTGKINITGKLGDVMTESVHAALSFIKSRAKEFGINSERFAKTDIHLHVPEGATPKDGPSAGIAICTSLVSLYTGIPVKCDIAMTGEITLRGRVLPIGGLKEKLLAAIRAGIKTVLIPFDNQKDLQELPTAIKRQVKIIPVKYVDHVLREALTQPLPTVGEPHENLIAPISMENSISSSSLKN